MSVVKKKTWPNIFEKILAGRKVHEFRLADFGLKEGDTLILQEWNPETEEYTGREIKKQVGYLSHFDVNNTFWSKEEIEEYGVYIVSLQDESV